MNAHKHRSQEKLNQNLNKKFVFNVLILSPITVLYRRDPGNIWEGLRYYMGGIQVLHGRNPGIISEGTSFLTERFIYYIGGNQIF